jgi:hypothetical protein
MKVIDQGHLYELEGFEGTPQTISFIKKESIPGSSDLKTIHDGTTNEEVIKVLIDRLAFLETKFPCKENRYAIDDLKSALFCLELRTKDRKARGVEGKHMK